MLILHDDGSAENYERTAELTARELMNQILSVMDLEDVIATLGERYGSEVLRGHVVGKPPILGQRDPRWGLLRYSNATSHTFYNYGCYLVTLTSLCRWAGYDVLPPDVAKYLDEQGAITNGDLIHPERIEGLCPKLTDYERHDWPVSPADVRHLAQLLTRNPVAVLLDFKPSWGLQSHFVLAYRYVYPKATQDDQLWVMDPWDGAYVDIAAPVQTNADGKRIGGGYFWPEWETQGAYGAGRITRVERLVYGSREFVVNMEA